MILDRWLATLASPDFRREVFERAPHAEPNTAREAIPFLNWETVARLLAVCTPDDVLIAKTGKLLEVPAPRTGEEVRAMLDEGISLVLRKTEDYDPGIRLVADAFTQLFDVDVTIHVFATPGGTHGFSWHYDAEEVFIAQTAGVKEFYLRQNTVNPSPRIDALPRDMQFEKETTPMIASTLVPGDWLYIPSGWWHVAKAIEDSLHLSIGVLMPRAGGRFKHEAAHANHERF
jgi:ribosomal protein L16 Arg81 hydroxylase